MTSYKIKKPIVLFIFKRPDKVQRVIDSLRQFKPEKLFIVSDGPRRDILNESDLVKKSREIAEGVDWKCEVSTNYSEINMGGPKRIPSGLDWVFTNVSSAIVLEDDILPTLDFFKFCDELLEHYENDTRVMHISGGNRGVSDDSNYSYYFGASPRVKGWATWKRAWDKWGKNLDVWAEPTSKRLLSHKFSTQGHFKKKVNRWDNLLAKKQFNWDLIWDFSIAINNGLVVVPNKNLTVNIGIGPGAQHSVIPNPWEPTLLPETMKFPVSHPKLIVSNLHADHACYKLQRSIFKRVIATIRRKVPCKYQHSFDRIVRKSLPWLRKKICDPYNMLSFQQPIKNKQADKV